MGAMVACAAQDHVANRFGIFENVMIPTPQNKEAATAQILIANRIVRRFGMLPAIDFDHNPCRQAYEIDDIWADRALTSEPHASELFSPERSPKPKFGVGHTMAKLSGEVAFFVRRA